jgi:Lrp/AsnC family transcriptional regulator
MDEQLALDPIDRQILQIVQADASLPVREISKKADVPTWLCRRRLERLEAAGVIKRRIALLDPKKLGLKLTAFVSVEVADHESATLADFTTKIAAMSEVMELYRLAGDADYGLRVAVPDMAAFDAFYRRLVAMTPLKRVTSRIALETIKSETAFPLFAMAEGDHGPLKPRQESKKIRGAGAAAQFAAEVELFAK